MARALEKKVIGITLGDPAGVGPELIEQVIHLWPRRDSAVLRVIGSDRKFTPGRLTKSGARVAMEALEESVELLKSGRIDAVVNGPVHKANLRRIGFEYPGQTEFYASRFGLREEEVTMMLASSKLRVSLVSTHLSLKEALRSLRSEAIISHGIRTLEGLRAMGLEKPRVAVCGLNPHAGEGGLFGEEESVIISPAIKRLRRRKNSVVTGPHVPDAVFRAAYEGKYDAVLCMYHDQGLIPLKLVGFDDGVNVTLGLPYWRTSPDHGTALDIAGRGSASPSSLLAAIRMVGKMVS